MASSQDNDALVVLGWNTKDPQRRIYEVDSWQQPGTEVIDTLERVLREKKAQWRPSAAMGDDQGHGAKKILNTLAPRLGIVFQQKAGHDVEATVRLMNTDLRLGRYRVRRGHDLATDMQMEVWDLKKNGKRTIGGARHSDLTSSARYAYLASRAHFSKGEQAPLTDPDEIAEAQYDKAMAAQQERQNRGRWR